MEVDAVSFPAHLLGMLDAIADADFVSLDLEFSGIPTRIRGGPRRRNRQTLEERYAEVKQGAEKYTILQVGITCARFDYVKNKYVLRPYNINISPLLSERLDIERDISFHSGAVDFLLQNGFQMDLPFTKGVQYLSRKEADDAKRIAYDRFDKKNLVEDLQLTEKDVQSLDFVQRVREEITKWGSKKTTELYIDSHTGLTEHPLNSSISRFEKRLVHQLVRAEFPDLVTITRNGYIQIVRFDAAREAENTKRLKSRVKDQIARQSGFRWVIEALANGDLSSIDPVYFCRNTSGMVIAADIDAIKNKLKRVQLQLHNHQPALVGHNIFIDLVYLYHTFIDDLPPTLQGFQAAINELFPRIVDTKYLSTYDGGDLHASPTLQEVADGLNKQPLPDIITHTDHPKYHDSEAFHEAGFDSLLTATVMIRLSAKIDHSLQVVATDNKSDGSYATAPETAVQDQGTSLLLDHEKTKTDLDLVAAPPIEKSPMADDYDKLQATPTSSSATNTRKKRKHKKKNISSSDVTAQRFATKNVFDQLQSLNNDEETPEGLTKEIAHPEASNASSPVMDSKPKAPDFQRRQPMELFPDFGSEFWKEFGNKLRCFGTQESVLEIADWK